jgi:hypothetical protein
LKVRQYHPQPGLTREEQIRLAIGKMEDDKILYKKLNYQEPTMHVLMMENGVQVDVCIEGMKKEDVPMYLTNRSSENLKG